MSLTLHLHRHHTPVDWATAAAAAIAASLQGPGRQHLLLSGGSTPAPVYRQLAAADLPWDRLTLGLADERWLPQDGQHRNDTLVAEHLLNHQPRARLHPLLHAGQTLQQCVDSANAHWQSQTGAHVAVLGMGNDGHTASLFPGAGNLAQALSSTLPYAALDATGCQAAQHFPLRISLTPAGLGHCRQRFLLLRGQDKLDTFNTARDNGDASRFPVLHAIQPGSCLHVFWCA